MPTIEIDCSVKEQGETGEEGAQRRRNPRARTRSLVADIKTPSGELIHGVSEDVSAFGASFIITGNRSALEGLKVGDEVLVHTSAARELKAEINSIRPLSAGDSRILVGVKLLDGLRWLSTACDVDALLDTENT